MKSYKFAVLTSSDRCSRGEAQDASGPLAIEMLKSAGGEQAAYDLVADDMGRIKERLLHYCDSLKVDAVITTGGTGFGPRDIMPEAAAGVIERHVPGLPELMRAEGLKKTKKAVLSRGIAGLRGRTLIINLPGSPKAVKESLEAVLDLIPHAIEMIEGGRH